MIVMLANYNRPTIHYWAGRGYPVGHLVSYQDWTMTRVYRWLTVAFDNGVWQARGKWSEGKYFAMLDEARMRGVRPRFALVPDCVGDRDETLRLWDKYAPRVAAYGWTLAFACQDGCLPSDIPKDAGVAFIGGTMPWKLQVIEQFCAEFPRVHIGRINTLERIWRCHDAGAESCDGTGWWRDGEMNPRLQKLETYFIGKRPPKQHDLFSDTLARHTADMVK